MVFSKATLFTQMLARNFKAPEKNHSMGIMFLVEGSQSISSNKRHKKIYDQILMRQMRPLVRRLHRDNFTFQLFVYLQLVSERRASIFQHMITPSFQATTTLTTTSFQTTNHHLFPRTRFYKLLFSISKNPYSIVKINPCLIDN